MRQLKLLTSRVALETSPVACPGMRVQERNASTDAVMAVRLSGDRVVHVTMPMWWRRRYA